MPLVHVHLGKGKSLKYIKAVCEGIHSALQTTSSSYLNIKAHFHFDKTILGVKRSDDVIVITSLARTVTRIDKESG